MRLASCTVIFRVQMETQFSVTSHGPLRRKLWFTSPPLERRILNNIASVTLVTISRHQGWVSLPSQGSWSWWEVGVLRGSNGGYVGKVETSLSENDECIEDEREIDNSPEEDNSDSKEITSDSEGCDLGSDLEDIDDDLEAFDDGSEDFDDGSEGDESDAGEIYGYNDPEDGLNPTPLRTFISHRHDVHMYEGDREFIGRCFQRVHELFAGYDPQSTHPSENRIDVEEDIGDGGPLQEGDRFAVIGCAQYPGWACHGSVGKLILEIYWEPEELGRASFEEAANVEARSEQS
jgi:hypothetical protein